MRGRRDIERPSVKQSNDKIGQSTSLAIRGLAASLAEAKIDAREYIDLSEEEYCDDDDYY